MRESQFLFRYFPTISGVSKKYVRPPIKFGIFYNIHKCSFWGKIVYIGKQALFICLGLATGCALLPVRSTVAIWPAPTGEALCGDYRLTVNGCPVPVLACRVSAMPFNQVWPGYQRPMGQTEIAGFASWDMDGAVRVEIESARPVKTVAVRPASRGIKPEIDGNRIRFALARPGAVVVEVDGWHRALHLFANPPAPAAPTVGTPGLRVFGPGVHHPGRIELKSNESIYLAPGAIVYGSLNANNATNLHIWGRGVIDVSQAERGKGGGAIRLSGCSDVTVEGLVLRDPDVWCFAMFGCSRVAVTNVKLIGLWRYNADGIDVCNSQDITVRDCFVRSYDDALVVKGLKSGFDAQPVRNVRFTRCTLWCDWGRAMEIGAETCAPEIADVAFEDCDVVRTTHIAMDIQHGDRAAVRDIRFQNIRVEIDPACPQPRLQKAPGETFPGNDREAFCPTLMTLVIFKTFYSKDTSRGTIRDVLFKDINVFSARPPPSSFRGFDAEHGVDGVTIENLRFNGRPVHDAADAHLSVGPHVGDIRFTVASH